MRGQLARVVSGDPFCIGLGLDFKKYESELIVEAFVCEVSLLE